jgi:hypothetical protein
MYGPVTGIYNENRWMTETLAKYVRTKTVQFIKIRGQNGEYFYYRKGCEEKAIRIAGVILISN